MPPVEEEDLVWQAARDVDIANPLSHQAHEELEKLTQLSAMHEKDTLRAQRRDKQASFQPLK
jgi:hypothetical protein